MTEFQRIKRFFDSGHLNLSDEWLECCVNWCQSDCLPPNYTEQELQVKVYEQWLMLDLREVQVVSLPGDISNKKEYTLNGTYCLQMMQIVDISKPKLWQLQRIRDTVGKNTEQENEFGKRVLLVTLTDGVQEIVAMEFKSISCLSLNLVPGIKIKIMGPIMVRNGRLMLESHHVKLLGGEVDSIRVSNAAENILARSLGVPENPDPFVINESLLTANMEILEASNHQGNPNNKAKKQDSLSDNRPNSNRSNTQASNKVVSKPPSFEIDEELLQQLQNDDFDEEVPDFSRSNLAVTRNNANKNEKSVESKKIARHCSSPDMFDDMDVDDALLNEHLNHLNKSLDDEVPYKTPSKNTIELERAPSSSARTGVRKPENTLSSKRNGDDDDDFFANCDLDAHLDHLDAEMRELPSSTQRVKEKFKSPKSDADNVDSSRNTVPVKSSVFTIEKLKKLQPNIGKGKFRIMAAFKDVAEKMTVNEETMQYSLVINVTDEKDELLLRVHSDLVSHWMKLSADNLINLKQLIYQKDMLAMEQFKTALTNLREKVMHLNGIMEVEIIRGEKHPILISSQSC